MIIAIKIFMIFGIFVAFTTEETAFDAKDKWFNVQKANFLYKKVKISSFHRLI